ncbi:hypothetical protein JTB14_023611 [Gonioctena quinquepunctata]|nr:hypothetical protein JTB14_023611 [Gonioctena quinquepunctata]
MKTSKATQTANLDPATDVVDLRPLLDSMIRTQVEHSICLQEIKQIIVNDGHESDVEKASFNFNLACDSLGALESLETYVRARSSCMKTIFTNSLGEICSWTGQKSNFPVSNLKFMELMFDVVHKKSSITKKKFEYYVKEWFRHSKQRRERETTKERENVI